MGAVTCAFPSPHSGILFLSAKCGANNHRSIKSGFRPLIRGFFFYEYRKYNDDSHEEVRVSVPSFGDSFFMIKTIKSYTAYLTVSVPSFGDSFFIGIVMIDKAMNVLCFRPLIRGFFFYQQD